MTLILATLAMFYIDELYKYCEMRIAVEASAAKAFT